MLRLSYFRINLTNEQHGRLIIGDQICWLNEYGLVENAQMIIIPKAKVCTRKRWKVRLMRNPIIHQRVYHEFSSNCQWYGTVLYIVAFHAIQCFLCYKSATLIMCCKVG